MKSRGDWRRYVGIHIGKPDVESRVGQTIQATIQESVHVDKSDMQARTTTTSQNIVDFETTSQNSKFPLNPYDMIEMVDVLKRLLEDVYVGG